MAESFEGVYEKGVFKPIKKIHLEEGTRAVVSVDKKELLKKLYQSIPLTTSKKNIDEARMEFLET